MKTMCFIILVCICALVLFTGCSTKPAAISASPEIAETDIPETATPLPSATQHETPGPDISVTPVILSLEEKLAAAPDMNGLKKEISGEEVIYTAEKGNPYKLRPGEYAGIYKHEVYIEGVQTGGIGLVPKAVLVLVEDELNAITEGDVKLRVALPLNISAAGWDEIHITNKPSQNPDGTEANMLEITCPKSVDIFNVIPGSKDFTIAWLGQKGHRMAVFMDDHIFEHPHAGNDDMMRHVWYYLMENTDLDTSISKLTVHFGKPLGKSGGKLIQIGCNEVGLAHSLLMDDILHAGKTPVFMTAAK